MTAAKPGLRSCLLLALALSSPCVHAVNLTEALKQARLSDREILSARAQRESVWEKLPQAQAALKPNVQLRAGTSVQNGHAAFDQAPGSTRVADARHWSVQINQVLWNKSAQYSVDHAHAQRRLADIQFLMADQELLIRVAQSYLEASVAAEHLNAINAQSKSICEQLALAQHHFKAGIATITDVHEARSRLHLLQAQKSAALIDFDSKQADLERLISHPVSSLKQLDPDQKLSGDELGVVDDWAASAREDSLQIQLHQAHLAIAEWDLRKTKAAGGPTLELTASYGGNYSKGSVTSPMDITSRSRSSQVGLQLNVPLYSGGGLDARIREAALLRDKAQHELEHAERMAISSVMKAMSGIRHGVCQVKALSLAVDASRASLDSNKVGYRVGTRISVDVLNAQEQLFAAKRDLYRAKVALVLSMLRLKAASGHLLDADLHTLDQLLVARESEDLT